MNKIMIRKVKPREHFNKAGKQPLFPDMASYCGKYVKVKKVSFNTYSIIESEIDWSWESDSFEPLTDFEKILFD